MEFKTKEQLIEFINEGNNFDNIFKGVWVSKNTNLTRSDLQGANLENADLYGTNLGFADLSFANLNSTYLQYLDLRKIKIITPKEKRKENE